MAIFLMVCVLDTAIVTAVEIDQSELHILAKNVNCSVLTSKGIEVGHLFSMETVFLACT